MCIAYTVSFFLLEAYIIIMECEKVVWNARKFFGMRESCLECEKVVWNARKLFGIRSYMTHAIFAQFAKPHFILAN
jgi:hypothetical protein